MNESKHNDKVFVIHGRNTAIRDSIFAFLRAIGLSPVEWSQAVTLTGKSAPFVSEVLDAAFANVQALVVLLTGDDVARLHPNFCKKDDPPYESQFMPQARANVLFEAGMALSTRPNQTVLLQVGDIRSFSDIGGKHILRLDNTAISRQQLAQRLQTAGCEVDLSGTAWHTAGTFEVHLPKPLPGVSPEVGFRLSKQYLTILDFVIALHRHFGTLHTRYIGPLYREVNSVKAGAAASDRTLLNCDELWGDYCVYYATTWPLDVDSRLAKLKDITEAFTSLVSEDSINRDASALIAASSNFFDAFMDCARNYALEHGAADQYIRTFARGDLTSLLQDQQSLAQFSAQLSSLSRSARCSIHFANNILYNLINVILSYQIG